MSTSLKRPFPKWPRFSRWFRLQHALKRRYRQKVERMQTIFNEDAKQMKLVGELADYASPIRRTMLQQHLPLDNLKIVLGKKSWPKQFKAGITKIVGMEIDWREGNV